MNDLLEQLRRLKLPADQYAIYGSGPMGIRGLKESNDLDVVVCDGYYKLLLNRYKEAGPGCIITGKIEIYPAWNSLIDEPEEVINRADEINGCKFIRLDDLIMWKKKMGRTKDIEDIKIIQKYLEAHVSKTKEVEEL